MDNPLVCMDHIRQQIPVIPVLGPALDPIRDLDDFPPFAHHLQTAAQWRDDS